MNKLNQRSALTTFILLLILSVSAIANADTIRIEFSGEFDDSTFGPGPESFDKLVGQPFQGVIQIPNLEGSEPTTEVLNILNFTPPQIDIGFFTVTPDSFISITTGVPEFDLFKEIPNSVFIQNCTDELFGFCFGTSDLINLGFSNGEVNTDLVLSPPFQSPLTSLTFPSISSVSVLQNLFASIEITTNDFSSSISSVDESFSFNITIIPDEEEDDFLLNYLPVILSTIDRK